MPQAGYRNRVVVLAEAINAHQPAFLEDARSLIGGLLQFWRHGVSS